MINLIKTEYGFDVPSDYKNPDWKYYDKVHGWRNYIGEETKKIWSTFTDKQKAAMAAGADEIAGRENWE